MIKDQATIKNHAVQRWNRRDWAILLALTALAAALRFYGLGTVPPGFQFDEAYNALDTAGVLAGQRPLFLPANGGREVIYTYLQAALASVFGLRLYTLRLTSALAGIAAVALGYVLLRRLLTRDSRLVAGLTSLVLAISFWHLHFSHYGIRVILMPVLFSGVCGLFWLGAQKQRAWPYLLSGILTGLSIWTHPTGRLVPFVLIGYVAWLLWTRRGRPRPAAEGHRPLFANPLAGLVLAGVAATIVFLPLGLEFYRHPDFFFGHASGVSVFADRVSGGSPILALLRQALAVLGMFSVQGDRAWIHNLSGRPVFDPLLSIPFWIGVVLWILRLRRRTDPDRDALAMLALWTIVMLLPSVLSDDAPNFSRTLPALPAVFVAAGLGLAEILRSGFRPAAWRQALGGETGQTSAETPPARPARDWPALAAVTLILLVSFGLAARDYFFSFPQRAESYYAYDADKLDALTHLQALQKDGQVYLSQLWGEHSTVSFLRRDSGIKSLDSSDTVVLPPPGRAAIYAFPAEQSERAQRLAALWPGARLEQVPDRYGRPLLVTVSVDAEALQGWPASLAPERPLHAAFAGAPSLVGMRAQGSEVYLFWTAEEQVSRSLTAMLHLVDARGERLGLADKVPGNTSYPTSVWTPGERVIERFRPAVDGCAGGEPLRVMTGWYDLEAGGQRVPRADGAGDTALAGEVRLPVTSRPAGQAQPPHVLNQELADGLTLLGYDAGDKDLQAGSPLALALYWQGGPSAASAGLAISLEGDAGSSQSLWRGPLAPDGAEWRPGEALCRRLQTRLPADVAPGRYRLRAAVGQGSAVLGEVNVGASTRRFEAPQLAVPISATLGDAVRLLGLTTAPAFSAGQPLTVTLVWQAATEVPGNYSAFVHLVDGQGRIVAQSDSAPAGSYTTDRWLAGEVVLDTRVLDAGQAGQGQGPYRLLAGMYDPVTGQRLPAQDKDERALPDNAVPLGQVAVP